MNTVEFDFDHADTLIDALRHEAPLVDVSHLDQPDSSSDVTSSSSLSAALGQAFLAIQHRSALMSTRLNALADDATRFTQHARVADSTLTSRWENTL